MRKEKGEAVCGYVSRTSRTIAVGSGKGGIGKSSITANLAVILARQGHLVVAMDADSGLANLAFMLGVPAGPTLHDLVEGRNDRDEALRQHPTGVRILPGFSGVAERADLDPHKLDGLLSSFKQLESSTDYLLVDIGAGVHEATIATFGAAGKALIVMNEDPSSFVDA